MSKFNIVIPSRYASERLPGKPLRDIAGKPMLQHVYERGLESNAGQVVIATDDERIETACRAFDAVVCMTGAHHQSGTDRLAEVEVRGLTDSVYRGRSLLPEIDLVQITLEDLALRVSRFDE